LESFATLNHSVMNQKICEHVRALRTWKNGLLKNALLVVFMESNFDAIMAQQVASMLHGITFAHPLRFPFSDAKRGKSTQKRYGIVTTADRKQAYVYHAQELLGARKLAFVQDGVCGTGHSGWVAAKTKLLQQMRAYKGLVKVPTDMAFGSFKTTYSGKHGNLKDDLCMAFQIALFFARQSLNNREFIRQCGSEFLPELPVDL